MSTAEATMATETRPGLAQGVWSPAITPFNDDLSPDTARYVAHVKWLLAQGCHGIAAFGTTSEATSLGMAERKTLLEALLEAGVAPERLMVGTGLCALPETVELTAHAAGLGCKSVLMLPPFYYKGVSDQGLFDSYSQVIERVADPALKIYFYHFPKLSGVPITAPLIEMLATAYPDNIAGLKDSSGDPANMSMLIERFPELAIFPGSETFLLPMLKQGGAGCITASANANPKAIRAVWDAFQAGQGDADDLQARITATRKAIEATPMVPTLKHLVAHYRSDPAWRRVRPPLTALDQAQGDALVDVLAGQGFSFDAG
ncbi:MAG: dihydrodipicolinate synthase family protein [Minwuiales bacterium]|nr:dihydrodipicolinate synthase family protein [Minwuiales bacterium]